VVTSTRPCTPSEPILLVSIHTRSDGGEGGDQHEACMASCPGVGVDAEQHNTRGAEQHESRGARPHNAWSHTGLITTRAWSHYTCDNLFSSIKQPALPSRRLVEH
jgi:hypothetical protein